MHQPNAILKGGPTFQLTDEDRIRFIADTTTKVKILKGNRYEHFETHTHNHHHRRQPTPRLHLDRLHLRRRIAPTPTATPTTPATRKPIDDHQVGEAPTGDLGQGGPADHPEQRGQVGGNQRHAHKRACRRIRTEGVCVGHSPQHRISPGRRVTARGRSVGRRVCWRAP
ncbi:DUF5988 family protein [Streptomyces sp. B21-106]|uniref:DUF5988 family protein n=1 Tax=Streptomyces sp. B21-106 TaxID=3039418 RepID=UPI002FEEA579